MKQEPPHNNNHLKKPMLFLFPATNFTKLFSYFIILLSCYLFGYFSNRTTTTIPNLQIQETSKIDYTNQNDHNLFSTHCINPIPSKLIRQTILDKIFNGKSPYQNFPPSHVSKLIRPRRIKGWGSHGSVFENLIRKVRPKTVIEVGTFLGASALHMVNITRNLGLNSTQILCIDDFRGWPGFREKIKMKGMEMVNGDIMLMYQFMQNIVEFNASESVIFLPFSTSSVLEKLCEWGVFGDLIEVDAGHDFHSAWSDINKAYKVLNKAGGVIFGHDYFTVADNRGVRRAVNLFAKVNKLKVEVDGQHWVIYPAAAGKSKTS